MTSFLQWRKMTWAILLAVVLGTVLVIGSGFSLFILGVSLGALGLLWLLRYLTEPLWRQGRGLGMRGRRQQPPVATFKPVKSLVEARPGRD